MTLGFVSFAVVEFLYLLDAAWPTNAILILRLALNCPMSYFVDADHVFLRSTEGE